MKLTELIKTCGGCPAQWEGMLEDGRMVYIRYRSGWLTIQVSKNKTKDVDEAVGGKYIFDKQIDEGPAGYMDYKELIKLTGHILDYSTIKEA